VVGRPGKSFGFGSDGRQRAQPEESSQGRPVEILPTPYVQAKHRMKLAGRMALVSLVVLAVVTGSLAGLTLVYSVDLPQIHDLERYRPSTTTDLYDHKGRLVGSFALEHRVVVNYDDLALVLRQAVISIEDKSFESHWGINIFRVAGAVWHDIHSHGRGQGASTLTMQLARNLFLSADRTATRKIQEAYLAIQIERAFTKQQIFTLYANQIYLGSGMYGFEAGSEYYFSKHAKELTLTEAALLAGLPKGPASYSPLINPEKALRRRNLVLSEMESDGVISHAQTEEARKQPLGLHIAQPGMSVAPWFEEEVRRELEKRFGAEQVHEAGLRVDTTLDLELQQTANQAVAEGLIAYEHRHGWSGKLGNVLTAGSTLGAYKHPDWAVHYKSGDYVHALVVHRTPTMIVARIGTEEVAIEPDDWKWTGQKNGEALVKPGDVIYVHLMDGMIAGRHRAALEQDSGVEGAMMAIDNTNGDVLAMVGGRDYALSEFNRATQAERQTGSSFKPYVYTAAVEDGVRPEDIVVDGPVSFGSYTPHNYEGDYKGAMTVLNAFAESRNIPALKLASRVGIHKVIDLAHRFGVTSNIPAYLPVALGAVEISLEEQVASYSVFPNDGIRVKPHFIRKVSNADGIVLWEETPTIDEVISQPTARTMMTLLREVMRSGTGSAAAQLNHPFGGKTGTTSDYTDAWFLGFSPSVTCGVWVGYDGRQSLGEKETGAKAALPIWMNVMRRAILGKEDEQFPGSEGIHASEAKTSTEIKSPPKSADAKNGNGTGTANGPGTAHPAMSFTHPPVKATPSNRVVNPPAGGANPPTANSAAPARRQSSPSAPPSPAAGTHTSAPAPSAPAAPLPARPVVRPALPLLQNSR